MSKEDTINVLKDLNYKIEEIGKSLMIIGNRSWGLGEIEKDGSVEIYSYDRGLQLIIDRFYLREQLKQKGILYTESGKDKARETLRQQKSQIEKTLAIL